METKNEAKTSVAQTLSEAVTVLEAAAAGDQNLSAEGRQTLAKVGKSLGAESLPFEIDGARVDLLAPPADLSPAVRATLGKLADGFKAMTAASNVEPVVFGDIPVQNSEIHQLLQNEYDSHSFARLFEFARENKVFAVRINEANGLVRTAEAEENWEMSGRQWVTDTVRCGDIERDVNPLAWRKAMLTLCKFYIQPEELDAIKKSVANPEYYRSGGLLDGVAHIFIPETLKRDLSWFNNKRLESHALALFGICETVIAGDGKTKYGFSKEELRENKNLIATTVANLAAYLKAINTNNGAIDFSAPSAGPWEEIPFPEGLTWDTEAARAAFAALKTMLALENELRNELAELVYKEQNWLRNKNGELDQVIAAAQKKVEERLLGENGPQENPNRPFDCSLAFISTSTIELDTNTVEDVKRHYSLLAAIEEKLVRQFGIIRYAPFALEVQRHDKSTTTEQVFDSYLADNYWLVPALRAHLSGQKSNLKDYGSSDCSTSEEYFERVKQARPETEAQWCFVSVIAEGYARQVAKLLNLQNGDFEAEPEAEAEIEQLITHGQSKAAEFLNRSFARITPAQSTGSSDYCKANGKPCPPFAIPEAYEMVSSIPDNRTETKTTGRQAALPGANTPLAWGQASLYNASKIFLANLQLLEKR